ncbi:hypothetical protein LTR28_001087 [Elasticomyces elasticus]|nr:hypothetical protein LTR28_001087 [Elasticomyces elasticus]
MQFRPPSPALRLYKLIKTPEYETANPGQDEDRMDEAGGANAMARPRDWVVRVKSLLSIWARDGLRSGAWPFVFPADGRQQFFSLGFSEHDLRPRRRFGGKAVLRSPEFGCDGTSRSRRLSLS